MTRTGMGSNITKLGYYSGLAATYQTLATWTVGSDLTGYLHEVSFGVASGGEAYAQFKLTINGVVQFEDTKLIGGVALPLDGQAAMVADTVVLLQVKSDGAHAIAVNGSITGREI